MDGKQEPIGCLWELLPLNWNEKPFPFRVHSRNVPAYQFSHFGRSPGIVVSYVSSFNPGYLANKTVLVVISNLLSVSNYSILPIKRDAACLLACLCMIVLTELKLVVICTCKAVYTCTHNRYTHVYEQNTVRNQTDQIRDFHNSIPPIYECKCKQSEKLCKYNQVIILTYTLAVAYHHHWNVQKYLKLKYKIEWHVTTI